MGGWGADVEDVVPVGVGVVGAALVRCVVGVRVDEGCEVV